MSDSTHVHVPPRAQTDVWRRRIGDKYQRANTVRAHTNLVHQCVFNSLLAFYQVSNRTLHPSDALHSCRDASPPFALRQQVVIYACTRRRCDLNRTK